MGEKRLHISRWASELARLALLLVATSMVTFALVGLSPVDPVRQNLGQAAYAQMSDAQRDQLAAYWGTDTPIVERYLRWASAALTGDFGQSLRFGRPVAEVVGERFANSAALMLAAWVLAGVLGLALGVAAGSRRGSLVDRAISGACYLLSSTPTFWLGLVALMVFAVWLRWAPLGFSVPLGVDAAQVSWAQKLRHLVLPALVLAVANTPSIALHTREKTIEVLSSDYVRFAQSRGETRAQILRRHGLCNLVLPAITIECASLSEVFGGSVLVEQVFSYPGLGQAAVTAGLGGDAPLLVAIALASAAFVFVGNAAANVLYTVVDPRLREGCAVDSRLDAAPVLHEAQATRGGNRRRMLIGLLTCAAFLAVVVAAGHVSAAAAVAVNFAEKNLAPCAAHLFGTDWMGRDMLARTLAGLSTSVFVGLLASLCSAAIALALALVAALGGRAADAVVSWLTDLMMGIPHIVLLILVSYALGRGFWGVTIAVATTHWGSLARVLRAEILQVKDAPYIKLACAAGASRATVAVRHILPAVLPQLIVGAVLAFPHAILHEASITFLGFGLSADEPAIGVILSEAMQYLSTGEWWLAVLPGAALVAVVAAFDRMGALLRGLLGAKSVQD